MSRGSEVIGQQWEIKLLVLTLDHVSVLSTDKLCRPLSHRSTKINEKQGVKHNLSTSTTSGRHGALKHCRRGGPNKTAPDTTNYRQVARWNQGVKSFCNDSHTHHILTRAVLRAGGGSKQMELLIKSIPACSVSVEVRAPFTITRTLTAVFPTDTNSCTNTKCVLAFPWGALHLLVLLLYDSLRFEW